MVSADLVGVFVCCNARLRRRDCHGVMASTITWRFARRPIRRGVTTRTGSIPHVRPSACFAPARQFASAVRVDLQGGPSRPESNVQGAELARQYRLGFARGVLRSAQPPHLDQVARGRRKALQHREYRSSLDSQKRRSTRNWTSRECARRGSLPLRAADSIHPEPTQLRFPPQVSTICQIRFRAAGQMKA